MNSIKKIVLSVLFIFSSYIPITNCSLDDLAIIQHVNDFVVQSISKMDTTNITPEILHILCNIFFSAFEYARLDLECNGLKRTFLAELNKIHKKESSDSTRPEEILKSFNDYEKARLFALQRWNHVSSFMNNNENITKLFTAIATERLEFLNTLVKNNNQDLVELITKLVTSSRTSVQKLHTINNFLQAASEKALPFDYENTYAQLQEIDILANITQHMHDELDTLRKSLIDFEEYTTTFLTLCAVLDMLYFNRLHEMLLEKSQDTIYHTILFNEQGIVPEDERVDLLPHVIN